MFAGVRGAGMGDGIAAADWGAGRAGGSRQEPSLTQALGGGEHECHATGQLAGRAARAAGVVVAGGVGEEQDWREMWECGGVSSGSGCLACKAGWYAMLAEAGLVDVSREALGRERSWAGGAARPRAGASTPRPPKKALMLMPMLMLMLISASASASSGRLQSAESRRLHYSFLALLLLLLLRCSCSAWQVQPQWRASPSPSPSPPPFPASASISADDAPQDNFSPACWHWHWHWHLASAWLTGVMHAHPRPRTPMATLLCPTWPLSAAAAAAPRMLHPTMLPISRARCFATCKHPCSPWTPLAPAARRLLHAHDMARIRPHFCSSARPPPSAHRHDASLLLLLLLAIAISPLCPR